MLGGFLNYIEVHHPQWNAKSLSEVHLSKAHLFFPELKCQAKVSGKIVQADTVVIGEQWGMYHLSCNLSKPDLFHFFCQESSPLSNFINHLISVFVVAEVICEIYFLLCTNSLKWLNAHGSSFSERYVLSRNRNRFWLRSQTEHPPSPPPKKILCACVYFSFLKAKAHLQWTVCSIGKNEDIVSRHWLPVITVLMRNELGMHRVQD